MESSHLTIHREINVKLNLLEYCVENVTSLTIADTFTREKNGKFFVPKSNITYDLWHKKL